MEIIAVKDLTKRYKNGVAALDGLNLAVQSGEIFTLLGPNGAGKSTLIQILTTFLKPSAGQVRVIGRDISENAAEIRSQISCAAQRVSVDQHLSLNENMLFQSRLYKVPKAVAKARMERLIRGFGLERYSEYPVATYSGGIKRRLDIALNMMSNPRILFLDEPTTGMDIQSRKAMWEMLKQIRAEYGTTIFLTTHYLEEADHLSDTVCIMKAGQEVLQGPPGMLRGYLQEEVLKVTFENHEDAAAAFQRIRERFNLQSADLFKTTITVNSGETREQFREINRLLLEQQLPFCGIALEQPSLDDVFIRLTGERGAEQAYGSY